MRGGGLGESLGILTDTLIVGGRRYILTAPTITALYFDLREYLRSLRPDPIKAAEEAIAGIRSLGLPTAEEARVRVAIEAAGEVTDQDIDQFERSLGGLAFRLWKALQAQHAADFPTLGSALDLIDRYHDENGDVALLQARLFRLTGEADAARCLWPEPELKSTTSPDLAGWPAILKYLSSEYGYTPEQVGGLRLLTMCVLLGAITPYHDVRSIPKLIFDRLASTERNRKILREVHHWTAI